MSLIFLAELDAWEDASLATGCETRFGNDSELLFHSATPLLKSSDNKVQR